MNFLEEKQKDLSCSVKNVLAASLPMMASIFSGALMQFVDRILLSHYSPMALNYALLSQQIYNTLLLPLLCFASLSEVFVGQLNGAHQWKETSAPTIQIAVFVCLVEILLAPILMSFRHQILPSSMYEGTYPCLLLGLGTIPFQVMHASFAAFFVGTRRPKVILLSVIIGNIFNAFLNWVFIFGIPSVLEPMGALGAATGTLLGTLISLLVLASFFFNRKNNNFYNTRTFRMNKAILKKNIFLGAPYSFAIFVDMSMWVVVTNALAEVSSEEVRVNYVCLSIWTFAFFIVEGLQKGVTALAANCIGARKEKNIPVLLKSVAKITLGIAALSYLYFQTFAPEILKACFNIPVLTALPHCKETLFLQWIGFSVMSFSLGGLVGILNAGGDTRFVTFLRLTCLLFSVIIPVLILSSTGSMRTIISWGLSALNICLICLLYVLRYASGKWNHNVMKEAPQENLSDL
ncbi:hypothetical protein AGMMS49949_02380 [Alphaproteobacteria bacterium]|nr:hypothetical protein AGMMS49949_02380 [Alphaproteobacteria bacterium]GHS96964.1 hypothetical protein AGMMS50296_3530 [Alphaproteobacteria bacterium]